MKTDFFTDEFADKSAIPLLLVFLFLRVPVAWAIEYFGIWTNNAVMGLFDIINLVLILVTFFLFRHQLAELKVDKFFIGFLILSGFLEVFASSVPVYFLLCLACIAGFVMVHRHYKNYYSQPTNFFIVMIVITIIIFLFLFLVRYKELSLSLLIKNVLNNLQYLAPVAIEEFVFRGLLCYILKKRGYGFSKVIIYQALIFWLCHLNQFFEIDSTMSVFLIWFFVVLPIISLFLGYASEKSKSLGVSTFAHIMYIFI